MNLTTTTTEFYQLFRALRTPPDLSALGPDHYPNPFLAPYQLVPQAVPQSLAPSCPHGDCDDCTQLAPAPSRERPTGDTPLGNLCARLHLNQMKRYKFWVQITPAVVANSGPGPVPKFRWQVMDVKWHEGNYPEGYINPETGEPNPSYPVRSHEHNRQTPNPYRGPHAPYYTILAGGSEWVVPAEHDPWFPTVGGGLGPHGENNYIQFEVEKEV